ncbi:chemotaxis protein CheW [Colwellia sp. BRX10-3]|uniref:chemotaxis protein CheW n=1 Tax=Colwellia sp. BRX10-3 TaxID=2759844 RepID=UPI0015F40C13|nr:chemotaxis protein CheW [Colwellia sp. BRX10-3]MBA6389428.1 chemotaxis protein CheW [Colwellia sp. BRX10-3]
MPKPLAASKKLMQTYLSELLTEEEIEQKPALPVKIKQAQPLDKLLNSATFPQVFAPENTKQLSSAKAENKILVQGLTITEPVIRQTVVKPVQKKVVARTAPRKPEVKPEIKPEFKPELTPELKSVTSAANVSENEIKTHKSSGGFVASKKLSYRQGDFQAMFFEVAGLTIAVPLIELGGIHNTDKTTPLMGKPDWFKGVMLHREEKVKVVDTARWVMPEKCDEALISALNYQYIIMLSDSSWGLTAEKLIDTVTLKQEDVKWLDSANKRPWLAGLVKNRMCALLDVGSLIKLLEKGANITQI